MPYDPDRHHRHSIRLPEYDYRQPGAYFVTVCTRDHVCLFGDVVEGRMSLNAYGRIVVEEWHRTEQIRDNVALDVFIVMPNHVHGIIGLTEEVQSLIDDASPTHRRGTMHRAPDNNRHFGQSQSGSLSTTVGAFKAAVTRRINRRWDTSGISVWQRNFYERVVRNQRELDRIRRYIRQNPARWYRDRHHPDRRG